jgi:hypothetical protein
MAASVLTDPALAALAAMEQEQRDAFDVSRVERHSMRADALARAQQWPGEMARLKAERDEAANANLSLIQRCANAEAERDKHDFPNTGVGRGCNLCARFEAERDAALAKLTELIAWAERDPQFINGNDSKYQAAVKMKSQAREILRRKGVSND